MVDSNHYGRRCSNLDTYTDSILYDRLKKKPARHVIGRARAYHGLSDDEITEREKYETGGKLALMATVRAIQIFGRLVLWRPK